MRGDSDFSPDVCVGQGVGVGKSEGGLSFYFGSPALSRAGCGAAEVPGGGGGSAAAADPPGSPPDSGRGVRMGSAGAPRKKPQHPNTNKQTKHQEKGGMGRCRAVEPRGRRCRQRAQRQRGESLQRREHRGDPRVTPGPAPSKVGPARRPRRSSSRLRPFGAARSAPRFGDRLSVAIKIKINSY